MSEEEEDKQQSEEEEKPEEEKIYDRPSEIAWEGSIEDPGAFEMPAMKALLKECITLEPNFSKIKDQLKFVLGIPEESLEMNQLHLLEMETLNSFKRLEERIVMYHEKAKISREHQKTAIEHLIERKATEARNDMRLNRFSLIALAVGFATAYGTPAAIGVLETVLRIFGF